MTSLLLACAVALLWLLLRRENRLVRQNELFDAVVDDMIDQYGEALRFPLLPDDDPRATLEAYAVSVLTTITRPQVVALHRIITGEASRFPQLGAAMEEKGSASGPRAARARSIAASVACASGRRGKANVRANRSRTAPA